MQSSTIEATTIQRWLSLFIEPGQVTELRMLPLPGSKVSCGFYDGQNLPEMARQARYESGRCAGVYFIPNPLKPETLARRANRTAVGKPNKGNMSHDSDVSRRKWLIIDIDPQRAKGSEKESSSDGEKAAAHDLMAEVGQLLERAGWLPPILIDSGNGYHAYYRLADADPQHTAIPTLLKSLSAVFTEQFPAAHIDTAIGNSARIMKVPGTMACKGTPTAERPHRLSTVISEGNPTAQPALPASGSLIAHTIGICETLAPPAKPVNRVFPKDAERPALPPRRSSPATSHYGARVLHEELRKIESATAGHRNTTLFAASCNILEVVAGGDIDATEADAAIRSAAESIGLDGSEIGQTIRSAADHVAGQARGSSTAAKVDLPDLPGWDALPTADDAAPVKATPAKPTGPPQLRNYRIETSGTGEQKEVGRPLGEITAEIIAKAGNWPKQCNGVLFVEVAKNDDPTIEFLKDSDHLFTWLASVYEVTSGNGIPGVDWGRGSDRPTEKKVQYSLLRSTEQFDSVEQFPHTPHLPNVWYSHRNLPKSTGTALESFLTYFNPSTTQDSLLIESAILTLFWGGTAGQRPGFLIDTENKKDGRGYGKTTLVEKITELVGGHIAIDPTSDDISVMMNSEGVATKRAVLIDNLKASHFSNGNIESFITSKTIAGRKLFAGYGSRPNHMTWFFTINGADLSKDMSQRLIPIHLKKPIYEGDWLRRIDEFIEDNRWAIIADIIAKLNGPSNPMTSPNSRHGAWESAVLSKLPDPDALAALIAERRIETDGDDEEGADVENTVADALRMKGFDPAADYVWISSDAIVEIVKGFSPHKSVTWTMRWLKKVCTAKLTPCRNTAKRGCDWNYRADESPLNYSEGKFPDIPDLY